MVQSSVPSIDPFAVSRYVLTLVPDSVPRIDPSFENPGLVPSIVPSYVSSGLSCLTPSAVPSSVPSFDSNALPNYVLSLSTCAVPSPVPSLDPSSVPRHALSLTLNTVPISVPFDFLGIAHGYNEVNIPQASNLVEMPCKNYTAQLLKLHGWDTTLPSD